MESPGCPKSSPDDNIQVHMQFSWIEQPKNLVWRSPEGSPTCGRGARWPADRVDMAGNHTPAKDPWRMNVRFQVCLRLLSEAFAVVQCIACRCYVKAREHRHRIASGHSCTSRKRIPQRMLRARGHIDWHAWPCMGKLDLHPLPRLIAIARSTNHSIPKQKRRRGE
jgi:hypothetical protein